METRPGKRGACVDLGGISFFASLDPLQFPSFNTCFVSFPCPDGLICVLSGYGCMCVCVFLAAWMVAALGNPLDRA